MATVAPIPTITATAITTTVSMRIPTDPALILHQWLSPAFPVGAFSYSHGLETLVSEKRITTAAALQAWLETVLCHGSGWCDAVLLKAAFAGNGTVEDLAELAGAMATARERRLETTAQGAAFAATVRAVWDVPVADAPYPVALGAAARALDLPLPLTLSLYLQAFASNLTSAGVRLIPLGQTEGQAIIAALAPMIKELAMRAAESSLDDLGAAMPVVDIAAMAHETLPSRIFRS